MRALWLALALLLPPADPAQQLPRVDLHVHIENDSNPADSLKPAQAAAISQQLGVRFGVLAEGGCRGDIHDNASLEAFLDSMKGQPMWAGLQVYGFDWQKCLSAANLARLDYISADALVMPDADGKNVLLWLPGVHFDDAEAFMDRYVDYNVRVLSQPSRSGPIPLTCLSRCTRAMPGSGHRSAWIASSRRRFATMSPSKSTRTSRFRAWRF